MMSLDNLSTDDVSSGSLRAVTIWLFVCLAMILVMVVLGGLTRLTGSGLSMVEWRPVTGWLPPMNELAWQGEFEKYQQYQEFRIKNPAMDLAGFKSIFWLEFLHRLWGRLIGVVFFIPFMFFVLCVRLDRALIKKLLFLFVLGAIQGALGWLLVKSGLGNLPDVSQYRLAAHLTLAFILYGCILWLALNLLFPKRYTFVQPMGGYKHACSALIVLLAITVISGAFVAGSDAGLIYNTFPLMGDTLLPKDMFVLEPWIKNFFENIVTIQFIHRVLTSLVLVGSLGLYCRMLLENIPIRTYIAAHCLVVMVTLQFILGVSTLLLEVPPVLAVAHQVGALLLLTVMLWLRHELRV